MTGSGVTCSPATSNGKVEARECIVAGPAETSAPKQRQSSLATNRTTAGTAAGAGVARGAAGVAAGAAWLSDKAGEAASGACTSPVPALAGSSSQNAHIRANAPGRLSPSESGGSLGGGGNRYGNALRIFLSERRSAKTGMALEAVPEAEFICSDRRSSRPSEASACSCVSSTPSMRRMRCLGNHRTAASRHDLPTSICTCLAVPSAPIKRRTAPTLPRQLGSLRPLRTATAQAQAALPSMAHRTSGRVEEQPVPVKMMPGGVGRARARRARA
mmetsp:Transcript_15641/g.51080  ORF Transcript_15641/g.51080 Transcript_15641/m.51080 type:complete len:273 (+) Transcript_15641:1941-2759(+)|eukprot:scaffold30887_cov101-Isochrysis_galbana.AAC.2